MIDRPFHDMGGTTAGAVDRSEHDQAFWEQRVDALQVLLTNAKRDGGPVMTVDEMRRSIESLGEQAYDEMAYYERWIAAITQVMLEHGVVTVDELGRKLADIESREE